MGLRLILNLENYENLEGISSETGFKVNVNYRYLFLKIVLDTHALMAEHVIDT